MKQILLLPLLGACCLVFLANLDGAFPENTDAPNEFNCGRAPCHNVPANVGAAEMAILFSGAGQEYLPDSTYQLTVSITNPQTFRNGFQILALDENLQNAGAWILTEPDKMKIIPGIGLPNRKYVTHKAAGNQQDSWTVSWKAPAFNTGKVTFYAAVNATNNNGMITGDQVYTSSLEIPHATQNSAKETPNGGLDIFPRPAKTGVWVDLSALTGTLYLTIFDSGGRIWLEEKKETGSLTFLATPDFPPGVYWLWVAGNGRQRYGYILIVP